MKPIVYFFMLFVGINSYSFAQNNSVKEDGARDEFLSLFVRAQVANDVAVLKKLIDKDAAIFIPGKIDNMRISRFDFLGMIRHTGTEQQRCTAYLEVLKADPENFTARIDLNYATYTIQNFVKVEKKANTWKITELRKTFPAQPEPITVMQ